MGAAPAEHVDVELVGLGEEEVGLVGDERETLEETDSQGAVGDDLGQRERGRLDVKAALDDLEVGRYRAEVLVGRLVGQVAQAESLGDFARGEELFELHGWQGVSVNGCRRVPLEEAVSAAVGRRRPSTYFGGDVESTVWDVEVPYHEDKEGHDGGVTGTATSEVRQVGEISSTGASRRQQVLAESRAPG